MIGHSERREFELSCPRNLKVECECIVKCLESALEETPKAEETLAGSKAKCKTKRFDALGAVGLMSKESSSLGVSTSASVVCRVPFLHNTLFCTHILLSAPSFAALGRRYTRLDYA